MRSFLKACWVGVWGGFLVVAAEAVAQAPGIEASAAEARGAIQARDTIARDTASARGEAMNKMVTEAVKAALRAGHLAARPDSTQPGGWTRGPLYRIRSVTARDERGTPIPGFGAADWEGEAAGASTFERMHADLQRALARMGFVFAEIRTQPRPDVEGKPFVDVVLDVRRGSAFKLGEPLPRGTRTRADVVRRLALWEEGENFDPARMERGLARLGRLGYFESATLGGVFRDSARNVIYPALVLPDARVNTLGGLLGYDTEAEGDARLTGFLDVHLVNIRGTARDFMFSFDGRTGREREARAAYTEPWIFGLPLGARWEGRFLQQDTVFWEWQQSLFVFRDLDFTSRLEVEFGAQENRDQIADASSSALLSGVRLLYDARDRAPFTRRGTRGQASATGLRRTLSGIADSTYYLAQLGAAVEQWQPLGDRFGLKYGGAAATNLPLDRLNHGELHDVGGARSLRGYRERQFQTNAYAIADVELQFTVGRRGRLFGFASPGFVNRPVGHYDLRRVFGYGAGLEVAQGDWSVALTYALNPERPFGDGYLHAAVENRF